MFIQKQIGKFNISIDDGALNHQNNRWYYSLRIDHFDRNDKYIDGNHFYIEGHRDNNSKEQFIIHESIQSWINTLTENEIKTIFTKQRNSKFRIKKPIITCVSEWR